MSKVGRRGFLERMAASAGVVALVPVASAAQANEPAVTVHRSEPHEATPRDVEVVVSPRTKYTEVIGTCDANGDVRPAPHAFITVLDMDGAPIYARSHGRTMLANPFMTDAQGRFEFWLDQSRRVTVRVSAPGYIDTSYQLAPAAPTAPVSETLTRDSGA